MQEERKHSVLGIVSTAIAIFFGSGMFTVIIAAGYFEMTTPGGVKDDSPIAMWIGLAVVAILTIIFAGFVLGIVGAALSNTKKTFSAIGIMLNFLILLGTIAIIIVGLMAE